MSPLTLKLIREANSPSDGGSSSPAYCQSTSCLVIYIYPFLHNFLSELCACISLSFCLSVSLQLLPPFPIPSPVCPSSLCSISCFLWSAAGMVNAEPMLRKQPSWCSAETLNVHVDSQSKYHSEGGHLIIRTMEIQVNERCRSNGFIPLNKVHYFTERKLSAEWEGRFISTVWN